MTTQIAPVILLVGLAVISAALIKCMIHTHHFNE
jgi:hypothetical protein